MARAAAAAFQTDDEVSPSAMDRPARNRRSGSSSSTDGGRLLLVRLGCASPVACAGGGAVRRLLPLLGLLVPGVTFAACAGAGISKDDEQVR